MKGKLKLDTLNRILKKYFKRDIEEVTGVQIDSSKVEKGNLFFAINGGNNYINDALNRGASLVIGDKISLINDNKVIKVENTIEILQELAKIYIENLKVKVIGITGSEGKTTTKDIIFSVLSEKYKCIKTQGNYNNQIGLPFTIFSLRDEDQVAILEMGMSSFGEIERLCEIAKPDFAVITNIGDSHLEFLINRENVFKAKTELLKYVLEENVIIYGDDFYLKNLNGIKVGQDNNNDYIISNVISTFEGINFSLNNEKYSIPLNGIHNCLNSSFAIVMGKLLNLNIKEIQKGLSNIKLTNMRFEKIYKSDKIYINDAYNASPVSMKASIDTFSDLPTEMDKLMFLGDMLELGENEIIYHKDILDYCLKMKDIKVFVYGERMKKALDILRTDKIKYISDKEEMIKIIQSLKKVIVLLKGSRGMKLEEIII